MSDIEAAFTAADAPRFPRGVNAVYKANHRSFGRFMISERMRSVTADVARAIAEAAKPLTPVGPGDGPHMADQYEVNEAAGTLKVGGNIRVKVDVVNSSGHAAEVEFGSKNNKRSRPLGRAGAMFGTFKPDGGP